MVWTPFEVIVEDSVMEREEEVVSIPELALAYAHVTKVATEYRGGALLEEMQVVRDELGDQPRVGEHWGMMDGTGGGEGVVVNAEEGCEYCSHGDFISYRPFKMVRGCGMVKDLATLTVTHCSW